MPNQDAKRGTQEKRERANTNTTHLARNGQKPRKGKEKEKAKADGHGPRPAEEGEDGSKIRDKAQRPSAFKSQLSGQLTCSTLELSAQLNLTKVSKRK